MRASYKKLLKLLTDKDLNKTDLRNATGISSFTIARMSRDEDVSTSILKRVCVGMKCDIVVNLTKRAIHTPSKRPLGLECLDRFADPERISNSIFRRLTWQSR